MAMRCGWPNCVFEAETEEILFDHVYEAHSHSGSNECCWKVDGLSAICGNKTPNKNHFRNHLVTHFSKSIRPLECNLCGARFRNRQEAWRHRKKKHSDVHALRGELFTRNNSRISESPESADTGETVGARQNRRKDSPLSATDISSHSPRNSPEFAANIADSYDFDFAPSNSDLEMPPMFRRNSTGSALDMRDVGSSGYPRLGDRVLERQPNSSFRPGYPVPASSWQQSDAKGKRNLELDIASIGSSLPAYVFKAGNGKLGISSASHMIDLRDSDRGFKRLKTSNGGKHAPIINGNDGIYARRHSLASTELASNFSAESVKGKDRVTQTGYISAARSKRTIFPLQNVLGDIESPYHHSEQRRNSFHHGEHQRNFLPETDTFSAFSLVGTNASYARRLCHLFSKHGNLSLPQQFFDATNNCIRIMGPFGRMSPSFIQSLHNFAAEKLKTMESKAIVDTVKVFVDVRVKDLSEEMLKAPARGFSDDSVNPLRFLLTQVVRQIYRSTVFFNNEE
ncbi:MAG: hypothetical protein SGCHY_005067 [Lobulomycetales sp.]